MRVVAPRTAAAFLEVALPLLTADEAANCLPIGLATSLRDEPGLYDEARFWVVTDERDDVIARGWGVFAVTGAALDVAATG